MPEDDTDVLRVQTHDGTAKYSMEKVTFAELSEAKEKFREIVSKKFITTTRPA